MKMKKVFSLSIGVFIAPFFFVACKHLPIDIPIGDGGNNNNNGGGGGGDTLTFGIPCDPDTVYFQNTIMPLILSNCAISGCHDAETHKEGLNMSTYEGIMDDHDDLVDPGNANNSDLYEQLFESGDDRMPPSPNAPLTSAEKELIYTWIEQGALNNYCEDCDTTEVTYAGTIAPIMSTFCIGCHDGSNASTSIDLTDYNGVSMQAESGALLGSVRHEVGYETMPFGGSWLPDCQIEQIRIWVESGYPDN